MSGTLSWCRACEGLCGVSLEVDGTGIQSLAGDRSHPNNAGFSCEIGKRAAAMARAGERLRRPLRRIGDRLEPVDWEEALRTIGAELTRIRKASGPQSLGLYAGAPLGQNPLGAARTGAMALGLGTTHLFSELALAGAPLLYASELMLGYPVPLQSDVGRAHYTLLLGADQDEARWGPLQAGTVHTQALQYFRRTRRFARVATAGHRATDLTRQADTVLSIRPGTELFLLLGMANAIAQGGWYEHQYLRDYTEGFPRAAEWLAPWTPARVAGICGVEAGDVSGLGLKFSRAAMATIARNAQLTQHHNGTLAAWAWYLVHALTANLLRPGGLFEARGLVDHQPACLAFPLRGAPRTRVDGFASLLLQAPATALSQEALTPGEGQLRALVCVAGDPLGRLPDTDRVHQALEGLELLVAIDAVETATTRRAHWVLPSTMFWERSDVSLLSLPMLPARTLQAAGPVLDPVGEARPEESILADLFRATRAPLRDGLRGGGWGLHLRLLGRLAATADLEGWIDRILELSGQPDLAALRDLPRGVDEGELNRAEWRVERPGARVDLAPEVLEHAVTGLRPPEADPDHPSWLVLRTLGPGHHGTRYTADEAAARAVRVHPASGLTQGAEVVVSTRFGEARGVCHLDEALREDTVEAPWSSLFEAGRLVDGGRLDPFTGTPTQVGLGCRVRALS